MDDCPDGRLSGWTFVWMDVCMDGRLSGWTMVLFPLKIVMDNLELVLKTNIQVSRVGLCPAENMANFSLRLS